MYRWKIILLGLVLLAMGASYSIPHLLQPDPGKLGYTCFRPAEWLEQFYKAVDRGELKLFMGGLTRQQIIPREVEQRFSLDSGLNTIIIHADLTRPQAIPGQDAIEVRSISSELDMDGHIIETKAHVYAKPGWEENH